MAQRASRINFDYRGFTIVELLIVIVVIAILAAITVVSYSGIQARSYDVAVQNDLSQIAKKIQMYQAEYNRLPTRIDGLPTMGLRVSKPVYGTTTSLSLWNDVATSQPLNLLYCHPAGQSTAWTLIARSRSGTIFRYGTTGVGTLGSVNAASGSMSVCASAGVTINGGDSDRTIFYNPVDSGTATNWWTWVGGN